MTQATETTMKSISHRLRRPASSGFTMIELLVVVAVIAVLIALLLPAIQSAREIARWTQCTNNLLQLGTAIGNYASSNKVFPPGVVNEKGPISNVPSGYHFGWAARILPFIEQGTTYNRLNFSFGVYAPANTTAQQITVQTFLCPSTALRGVINYAGCHHDVEAPIDVDNHGVFFLNSRIGYDDLVDGPAYTILVGETSRSAAVGSWAVGTSITLRNTGWGVNNSNADPFTSLTPPPPPAGVHRIFDPSVLQSLIDSGQFNHELVGGFSSQHSSGANSLFGDGSVRLLKNKIRPEVLRSLGHRSDGNLIDSDAY
jgi:prepilin-type N-terminal cleavage/methylation domain-containing protein/prepilin-type processing-associated H-X9-DG protein